MGTKCLSPFCPLEVDRLTQDSITTEAQRRFELYMNGNDKAAIPSNLRSAIFGISMRYGDKSEYQALKNEWQTTTSIDGKEISFRAMGRLRNLELLPDYLDFLFNTVPTQDKHTGGMALAVNSETRESLWRYIQDNFDTIYKSLSKNMIVLDRFLKVSLGKFNDKKTEKEISTFFEGKDNRGYDRTLNVVKDTILSRASYKERDSKIVLEWLKTHGYA